MRRLKPKLLETARTLLLLYVTLAAVLVALLTLVLVASHRRIDDALFQSLTHILSAYSTGGFATSATPQLLENPAAAAILVVAMLLGGTNFTLLFLLFRRRDARLLWDPEWRFWLSILGAAMLLNAIVLIGHGFGIIAGVGQSILGITAFGTGTAGLAPGEYATAWPSASILIVILLMVMGGMSGSAAGGVKGSRWLILFKMLGRELKKILHPRAIIPVRIGDRVLKEETLSAVAAFFFTYLATWTLATLLITATDPSHFDLESGAFATAASLGNAGGGLHALGPVLGYSLAAGTSKLILALLMWAGRLELFAALLLFNPKSWKN